MNTLFTSVFLFSFLASSVFAQFQINTPTTIVQCQPILLSWTGGTPEYFLSVLPAGQPSAAALITFQPLNDTSLTWKVNVTAGVGVFFNLRDSTGALAQSGSVTVQTSSDNSCINASAVVPITGSTTAVATTSSISGSTSATGISAPATTSGSNSKGASASSTSTGATTSPSRAAAASHSAPYGTLAMAGAALAFALVL